MSQSAQMTDGRYCVLVCGHMNAEIEKRCVLHSQHVDLPSFSVPQQKSALQPMIPPRYQCLNTSQEVTQN